MEQKLNSNDEQCRHTCRFHINKLLILDVEDNISVVFFGLDLFKDLFASISHCDSGSLGGMENKKIQHHLHKNHELTTLLAQVTESPVKRKLVV